LRILPRGPVSSPRIVYMLGEPFFFLFFSCFLFVLSFFTGGALCGHLPQGPDQAPEVGDAAAGRVCPGASPGRGRGGAAWGRMRRRSLCRPCDGVQVRRSAHARGRRQVRGPRARLEAAGACGGKAGERLEDGGSGWGSHAPHPVVMTTDVRDWVIDVTVLVSDRYTLNLTVLVAAC